VNLKERMIKLVDRIKSKKADELDIESETNNVINLLEERERRLRVSCYNYMLNLPAFKGLDEEMAQLEKKEYEEQGINTDN